MRYFVFMLLGLLVLVPAQAQAEDVDGYWLTENKRGVVYIEPCDRGMCGFMHWTVPDAEQYDIYNPDKSMRNRPVCDMPILWGFKNTAPGVWEEGTIYKVDDGDTYHSNLKLQEDGTLLLRGYIGIPLLGKSQVWNRVDGSKYPRCQKPG